MVWTDPQISSHQLLLMLLPVRLALSYSWKSKKILKKKNQKNSANETLSYFTSGDHSLNPEPFVNHCKRFFSAGVELISVSPFPAQPATHSILTNGDSNNQFVGKLT